VWQTFRYRRIQFVFARNDRIMRRSPDRGVEQAGDVVLEGLAAQT
jgi:hypothetical protein